jgi:aspartyl-tRNA(Asn)/glutamyl-tRNA(Gln) amidotransferase subunit B
MNGYLDIEVSSQTKRIGIRRAHLEEDAGKLIHEGQLSLVDYNRTGQPLLEIVTEPDISSPEEAYAYLTDLKSIIQYLGVSDCDMEKGTLRCDANISVRPKGSTGLGTKSELKNLNSFKAVRDALHYEIQRHIETLGSGDEIIQETRLWDEKGGRTNSMRSKEEAKDYRYFPEPDLPPFLISKELVQRLRAAIPELPRQKSQRFMREYGLSEYDAKILAGNRADAEFAESMIKEYKQTNKKTVANWLIGPLAAAASGNGCSISELKISATQLLGLIEAVESGTISNLTGKTVLGEMLASGKTCAQIVKEKNLAQVSDESSLSAEIEAVISENEKSVNDFKAGKENALMFLVGQVMKKSKGKANPKIVQDLLRRRLTNA